jgi:hypothetical protein
MQVRLWGWIAAASMLLFALPRPADAQYYGGELVRCESRDYRQVYCDIDVRGGVRIVNQLSSTACVEGRTWGWDRRGVWVSGGCRAEFDIAGGGAHSGYDHGRGDGYGYGGGDQVVRCESRDYRQVYCNVDVSGGVRLANQLSGTDCIEGQTWGADRRGLWVRGGCRGEFELGRGGGGYGYGRRDNLPIDRPAPYAYGQGNVICESRDNRYRHCPASIRREAQLVRQLSDTHCVFNRSWGFDRNGVWVDRGCRGEFSVY